MEIKSERQVLMSVLSWNPVLLSFKSLSESMALVWRGWGKRKRKRRQERTPRCRARPLPPFRVHGMPDLLLERAVPASELSHPLWAQEVVPYPAHSTSERRPFQIPSFLFPIQPLPTVRPPSLWVSSSFSGEAGTWQEVPLVWPSQGSGTWVTWVKGRSMGKGMSLSWP